VSGSTPRELAQFRRFGSLYVITKSDTAGEVIFARDERATTDFTSASHPYIVLGSDFPSVSVTKTQTWADSQICGSLATFGDVGARGIQGVY